MVKVRTDLFSYAGAVPAGGLFALMQSAGMTGALGTAGILAGGSALVGNESS